MDRSGFWVGALGLVGGASLVLSACASGPDREPRTTPSPSRSSGMSPPRSPRPPEQTTGLEPWTRLFAASRNTDGAPREIQRGSGRINCGEVVLKLKVPSMEVPTSARTCFEGHIGKAAAELAVITQTVEGDPVVNFYLTAAGLAGYDVVTDWQWDKFGPGGWSTARCAGATTFGIGAEDCRPR